MDTDFDMQKRWFEELDDHLNAGEDDASDPAIGQEAAGDVSGDADTNSQGPLAEDGDDQLAIGQETPHGPVTIGHIFTDIDVAAAIAAADLLRPFDVLDLNASLARLQPWFAELDLSNVPGLEFPPGARCDVPVIINNPPLSEQWREVLILARHFARLRVMRMPWGRSRQQQLDDGQKEIFAFGYGKRREIGPYWQPPFGTTHPFEGWPMYMGTIERTLPEILHYVAGNDMEVYSDVLGALRVSIVPRIRDGAYGDLAVLAGSDYFRHPSTLPDLVGKPYCSDPYRDILGLFLGNRDTSISGHWLGLGTQHPKIPICLQVNCALLLTWAIRAAMDNNEHLVFQLEEFDFEGHLWLLIQLWSQPESIAYLSQMEDECLRSAGLL